MLLFVILIKKILRLKKFKDIKIYKNSDDLINDKTINTVSICTYDHFHMDQIIKCLKNNKNVFCEKPLCFNYDQFKILKKTSSLWWIFGNQL